MGTYLLVDLPCPYVAGRFEQLQITLGEFRNVRIPGAAGAAAAGGEGG